jgi:hypothetical protein
MLSINFAPQPYSVAAGDFNNDNRSDIVVANSGVDNIGIFLGYGDGRFASVITFSTGIGSQPYSVAVADFNNDGQIDIVVVNVGSKNINILYGYGNGSFTDVKTYSNGHDVMLCHKRKRFEYHFNR